MLIILGGLPGTGKTVLARLLAGRLGALHLRIDSIEQAIRESWLRPQDVGDAGYRAAYAVAEDNLRLGRRVIADSVNPLALTRSAWRAVAERAGAPFLEVELVCSDRAEHRRRIESRAADIAGLTLPDWAAVERRQYEPWPQPHLLLDTAVLNADECAERVLTGLADRKGEELHPSTGSEQGAPPG